MDCVYAYGCATIAVDMIVSAVRSSGGRRARAPAVRASDGELRPHCFTNGVILLYNNASAAYGERGLIIPAGDER